MDNLNIHTNTKVYKPRKPQASAYFQCVSAHYEELENIWEDYYEYNYGFWRSYVQDVILKYLDCGDLHCGFARIRCDNCGNEYLLAFSCKRRHFCPSCHQKRVVEFGEHLCENILKPVPHRHWVFSIPKRLRKYFLFDRSLLAKLSSCAAKVLRVYLKKLVGNEDTDCGIIVAVHTFGDFLGT